MGIKERVSTIGSGLVATGVVIATTYACSPRNDTLEIAQDTQPRISESSEKTVDVASEDNESLVNEADFRIARENLLETIDWMDSQENSQIRAVADFIRKEVKRENFNISWGINKEAYVPPASKSEKPKIAFSIRWLSDSEFNEEKAAVSLFEASYIYQKTLEDPERYSLDMAFRLDLEQEAQTEATQVFYRPETK